MKQKPIVQIYMGWPADYIRNEVTIILDPFRAGPPGTFFYVEEDFELEISKPSK